MVLDGTKSIIILLMVHMYKVVHACIIITVHMIALCTYMYMYTSNNTHVHVHVITYKYMNMNVACSVLVHLLVELEACIQHTACSTTCTHT